MIRIGCQTITWGPEMNRNNPADVFREVSAAGFEGIEIGARHLDMEKPDYYKGLLRDNGLELVALHVGGDFLDRESVNRQIENIGSAVKMASVLGSKFLFLSGTHKPGKSMEDYKFESQTYNLIGKLCGENGLTLCYHNHDWEIRNGLEGFKILEENMDPSLVGFVLDVGWVTWGGADPVEQIDRLGDRVKALHFKEFTESGGFTETGRGVVNFRDCYDRVKNRNMWIVAEQDQTAATPLESAAINYTYINGLKR